MSQQATAVQADIVIEHKVYELPTAELHTARITRIEDLGVVKSELYGDQEKVKLHYLITDAKSSKGEELFVFETCSKSIGEKARLGKRLRSLGVNTDKSAGPVHMKDIVGMDVTIGVVHNTKGDKTYANIDYVAPLKSSKRQVATPVAEV
jgi:hypothetical protein